MSNILLSHLPTRTISLKKHIYIPKIMESSDGLVGLDPVSLKEGIYSIRLEANNCAVIDPGTVQYPDGTLYMGGFQRGKRHGAGRWFNPATNDEYDGEWVADKRHGHGVQHSITVVRGSSSTETTSTLYKGAWVDDVRAGHGVETYGDGRCYEGNFVNNCQEGAGSLRYVNGDVYTGEFHNNAPHGKGRLTYSNGDTMEGAFREGKRHGDSIACYAASGKRYLCVWNNDVLEGLPSLVTI